MANTLANAPIISIIVLKSIMCISLNGEITKFSFVPLIFVAAGHEGKSSNYIRFQQNEALLCEQILKTAQQTQYLRHADCCDKDEDDYICRN